MKRLVLTIISFFFIFVPSLLAGNNKYAQATFPKKTYDFGYIKAKDGVVTCEFEFINTGTEPLVIYWADPTCGCTVPDFPKKPIKPDERGIIKISFNPAGYEGGFLKTVKVRTNGREKSTTLSLEGSVIPK